MQTILQDYLTEKNIPTPSQASSVVLVRHWFNPNLEFVWFVAPSLVAIITTISTLIVSALSVAREKECGTLDQLLVSPLTPEMIVIGKTLPALLVAMRRFVPQAHTKRQGHIITPDRGFSNGTNCAK